MTTQSHVDRIHSAIMSSIEKQQAIERALDAVQYWADELIVEAKGLCGRIGDGKVDRCVALCESELSTTLATLRTAIEERGKA